jgi:hypothetical protein
MQEYFRRLMKLDLNGFSRKGPNVVLIFNTKCIDTL